MPGETNTSIRPGWFYHASEDARVKSPGGLMELYFESVGRGTNLLLNVPPNRHGVIHQNDVGTLWEWSAICGPPLKRTLRAAPGLRKQYPGRPPPLRAGPCPEKPEGIGRRTTAPPPRTAAFISEPATFNVVRLKEYLPLGARVDDFALDFWDGKEWEQFALRAASAASGCLLRAISPRTGFACESPSIGLPGDLRVRPL